MAWLVRGAGVAAVLWSVAAGAADTVVIRMADYKFEPPELVLEHGKAYRLRFENVGKDMHEFTAGVFFQAAQVGDRGQLTHDGTELGVQPGQTRELDIVAPAAGTYALTCPDHDWAGMVGKIVVR